MSCLEPIIWCLTVHIGYYRHVYFLSKDWKMQNSEEFFKLLSLLYDVLGEAKEIKQEENELLFSELLEKSAEVSHVQKQLEDLHKGTEVIEEKEEALASLREERKAREEAHSRLDSLNKSLEAEKMARIEAIAALEEAKQRGDKDLAALSKEKSEKEELQSALEVQREEVSRLIKEGVRREQEANQLQEQVDKLTAKLEASQQQVGPKIVVIMVTSETS